MKQNEEMRTMSERSGGRMMTEAEMRAYQARKKKYIAQRRREVRRQRVLGIMGGLLLLGALALFLWLLWTYLEGQNELRRQEELMSVWQNETGESMQAEQQNTQDTPTENATEESVQAEDASETETEAATEPTEDPTEAPTEEPTEASGVNYADMPVSQKFGALMEINPDIIGWLDVSTEISTPVVWRDNEYYMNKDFYGETSEAGTVFADEYNDSWMTDQYLIFYGHNMKNDSMFGKMDQFAGQDYLKEHAYVKFQTAYNDEVREYVPFAVVDATVDPDEDGYFFLRRMDIFDEETRDEAAIADFLTEIRERSLFEIPVEVTQQDRILCLVTCSYDLPDARFMVFCRQVREGESADELRIHIWSETR